MVIFGILLIALFIYFATKNKKVPQRKEEFITKIVVKYRDIIKYIFDYSDSLEVTYLTDNHLTITQEIDDINKIEYILINTNGKIKIQYIYTISSPEEPITLDWEYPENHNQQFIIRDISATLNELKNETVEYVNEVSNKERFHLNMVKLYESLIESAIYECETEFLIPLAIQGAITSGKKVAEEECSKLANEFKLTTNEIKQIINKSGKEIYNKYLETNPNIDKIFNT